MKVKVFIIIFLFLIINSKSVLAQRDIEDGADVPLKYRLYFGGNFGLQLGDVTFIDVSPLVGYMINSKLSAGVGVTYQYYRYSARISSTQTLKTSFNIYGGRLFGRYNLSEQLFAYTEYESISLPYIANDFSEQREWIPALYLGGGYVQRFGPRGGLSIMGLYNILYDQRAISNSPFTIRVGFFI